MPFHIGEHDGYFEVRVWGQTTKHEILQAVGELARRNVGKQHPDVWLVAAESQVPFSDFWQIAGGIQALMPPGMTGSRSAIVAGDEFHKAQLEFFRKEAAILPYEIRVFRSEAEAVQWVMSPRASNRDAGAPGTAPAAG